MKPAARQKARILTTESEMTKAVAAARRREQRATKIRQAHYDSKRDVVIVQLSTGSTLTVPRRVIPGFARIRTAALGDLEITSGREGLWSDNADDGVLLEQLIVLAAGEAMVGTIGARINATKKSPARAAASRANGVKGGRPRKAAA
jgi:hypothetical protein